MKLELAYTLIGNASGEVEQPIRVIVFRWGDNRGVTPSAFAVLDNAAVGGVNSTKAFYEYDNKNVTILSDDTYIVGNATITGNLNALAYIPMRPSVIEIKRQYFGQKLKKKVSYLIGANLYEDGGFYVLAISNVNVNGPSIRMISRMTYEDA